MLIIIGILALVAAGAFIAYHIFLNLETLNNKMKEKAKLEGAKKVLAANLKDMCRNCDNVHTMEEIDKLVQEGHTDVLAATDENGEIIGEVDLMTDDKPVRDEAVKKLFGKQGMEVTVV